MNYLPVLVLFFIISCAPATDGERAAMDCQAKLKDQNKIEDELKSCVQDREFREHQDYLDSLTY